MGNKILRLGLVGKDVSQSTSHRVHAFILNSFGYGCEYEKISASPDGFDAAMRYFLGDFDGFNVTIPYKKDVMEYLDGVVGDAISFNAVNTVVCATGKGYNTDGEGFLLMSRLAGLSFAGKRVLVLGGGGAGRSTAVVVKKSGGQVFLYQRNREKLQETCEALGLTPVASPESGGFDILVNATGVGMHDTVGQSPVTKKAFFGAEAAIDLIYYPVESEFLRLAKAEGLKTLNGAPMLFYQAYYADCLFLGIAPNDKQAEALYIGYQKQTEEKAL